MQLSLFTRIKPKHTLERDQRYFKVSYLQRKYWYWWKNTIIWQSKKTKVNLRESEICSSKFVDIDLKNVAEVDQHVRCSLSSASDVNASGYDVRTLTASCLQNEDIESLEIWSGWLPIRSYQSHLLRLINIMCLWWMQLQRKVLV